jgi:hypothetical protein
LEEAKARGVARAKELEEKAEANVREAQDKAEAANKVRIETKVVVQFETFCRANEKKAKKENKKNEKEEKAKNEEEEAQAAERRDMAAQLAATFAKEKALEKTKTN